MTVSLVDGYHQSSAASAQAYSTISSNNNMEKPPDIKVNVLGDTGHSEKVKRNSQTDSAGLVAMIVVLILLLVGSAAAFLLMRRHFAKRREMMLAATAAASKEPREEGGLQNLVVLQIPTGNESVEGFVERRRSFADGSSKV
ncbi:hypothetical protein ANO14919_076310 [Xylariales sp. No.14919]|nr:hypothetical protein F5X98DRAFT_146472 [Xylaria grammica]GAW18157.1 hypothetical protein ANO14919_076310 [Xylariales sp. No.14919]